MGAAPAARLAAMRPRFAAVLRYLRGIAFTSFVGSLATMPYAAFHFDRATHYAVLGNLGAMPIMGSSPCRRRISVSRCRSGSIHGRCIPGLGDRGDAGGGAVCVPSAGRGVDRRRMADDALVLCLGRRIVDRGLASALALARSRAAVGGRGDGISCDPRPTSSWRAMARRWRCAGATDGCI